MSQLVLLVVDGGLVLAAEMNERIDQLTAMRVDLTLILLPLIGWLEASVTLAANEVPLEVAARVMALPMERRAVTEWRDRSRRRRVRWRGEWHRMGLAAFQRRQLPPAGRAG